MIIPILWEEQPAKNVFHFAGAMRNPERVSHACVPCQYIDIKLVFLEVEKYADICGKAKKQG